MNTGTMIYEGSNFFRQRLVLATLSGKTVKIKKIRWKAEDPGIIDCEANFIRLLDTITNGSRIDVNQTGTIVYYQPGVLIGGEFTHECNLQRAIGYYLEALLTLAPFCKKPIKVTLKGITNMENDHSYDSIKYAMLPVLKRFLGTDEGLNITLQKRGAAPLGGGQLKFECPIKPKLRPLHLTEHGKIKLIRGTAWANRVPPSVLKRLVDAAKGPLLKILSDVYIYTDHLKGNQAGKSPGFGITLMAETTDGVLYSAELCSKPKNTEEISEASIPEDISINCVKMLFDEIYRGGCVDSNVQSLVCVLMTLGDKDISKVRTGPLSPYTIRYLRHIKDFFNVIFKVDASYIEKVNDDDESERQSILLTCVGAGYRNVAKVTL